MAKGKGFNMMQQVKMIQERLASLQEELGEKTVEASVGGGMVVAVANGKQEILSITIEREVVDPDDIEMLQDLIVAAVNEAIKKSQEMVAQEMSKITGGLNIPGLKVPGLM
ncbi:MAG TPA: YbaB/EbfC family nucleoid-associated protein [Deltaproteobacteria bacterium]|nr:YbaB/EbfC family nucleoid-associated protein [Deltaproteobacteria bacterium]